MCGDGGRSLGSGGDNGCGAHGCGVRLCGACAAGHRCGRGKEKRGADGTGGDRIQGGTTDRIEKDKKHIKTEKKMRIVDESSNAGRQIVPEDMNYLSLADREVVAALGAMMAMMVQAEESDALVVSGCDAYLGGDNSGDLRQVVYTIGDGVVLWRGVLYDLTGAELTGRTRAKDYDQEWVVAFYQDRVESPSPVYGMDLALDQEPHKRAWAEVRYGEEVPKSVPTVPLGKVKRLPKLGTARPISSTAAFRLEVLIGGSDQ